MARVTVEDCIEVINNRFEMVLSAARRSRQLLNGAEPNLEWENDKPTVMALREIAEGIITKDVLNEAENLNVMSIEETVAAEESDSLRTLFN